MNSTNSPNAMILRSRCHGGNCECEHMPLLTKISRTPLLKQRSDSSPKAETSPSILKKTRTVSKTAETFHMKETDVKLSESFASREENSSFKSDNVSVQNDITNYNNLNNAAASKLNGYGDKSSFLSYGKSAFVKLKKLNQKELVAQSFSSDYSSGFDDSDLEERAKTDYTYSQSRSYTSRGTPSRDSISPNMSRTRLRRSLGEYSSDEEISYLLHEQKKRTESDFKSSNVFSFGDTSVPSSTPLFFRDSEFNNNVRSQNHQNLHYSLETIERHSFLSRIFSFIVYTCILGFVSTICNVWYTFFKTLYRIFRLALIADVWLLLQVRKRKYLLLLPLLLFFLFWMLGGSDKESVIRNIPSSLAASSASYLSFLSNWSDFKSLGAFWPGGVNSLTSEQELYQKMGAGDLKIDTEQFRAILKELVSLESKSTLEKFASQRDEDIRRILLEVTSKKDASSEHEINLKNLISQSNLLSEELVTIKAAMVKNEERGTEERQTETHFEFLRTKLSGVEAKLDTLQAEIAAQRNCCKNQTTANSDKKFVNLMFDIFNASSGSGQERLEHFRTTILNLFANQRDFKAKMDQIDHFLSGELGAKIQRIANKEATVIANEKMNGLRAEFKYNENKKTETFQGGSYSLMENRTKCTSTDDVRRIVKRALFVYDADKTGQVDFALETSGGSVISTRCAENYFIGSGQYRLFGVPFWWTSNSPRIAIQPEVHPGQCWAFKGSYGYLVIQLSSTIRPKAFTLEHIHKSLSPTGNIDSAPKDFAVFGLRAEDDFDGKLLGRYSFEDNDEPLQYFIVQDPDPGEFSIIELRINSNHGNNDYTCLYRFRVHGERV